MEIHEHVSLAKYSTFRIGGTARFFTIAKTVDDIKIASNFVSAKKIPLFILGGGSNILIADTEFAGLVLKNELKGISYEDRGDYVLTSSNAGESWDSLVSETVSRGLYGLENLSLIPGTVGAAPVQNIGAYGKEVKDFIEFVEVFDLQSNIARVLSRKECDFGYRTSFFKRQTSKHLVITKVVFRLQKKGAIDIEYKDLKEYFSKQSIQPNLARVREAVIAIRTRKMPSLQMFGTAGSFWKNPIISNEHATKLKKQHPGLPVFDAESGMSKISLAWLLDNVLHMKGYTKDRVGLYKEQPLVVISSFGATARDIETLATEVAKKVFDATGITIEKEVEYVS